MAPGLVQERCEGCGARVPGGTKGCQAMFDEILARDFTDALYFGVHRMVVDVYSLQHPDRYCRSATSLAAHLCGLCQILESGASPAVGNPALQRWLSGRVSLVKPELPSSRGELTLADVRDASEPAAWADAVERWARSTWEAYRSLHDLAREWLEQARRA